MAKKNNTRHVVPNQDGGWSSKKGGADRASKNFETKKQAEQWSRDLSRHKKDGTIQRKDSHGNDPYPPKG